MIVKHRQQFSSYKIKIDARTEKTELQPLQSKMPIGNLRMHYSDRPTAGIYENS